MNAFQPTVSVITPCLNARDHIDRCLASVRNQAYGPVQHIVVDGGSHDGTAEMLAKAVGIEWLSEPDGGQSEALIKGFGLARGEIVTWLNADDALTPDALSEVVGRFSQDELLAWVTGRGLITRGEGTTIEPVFRVRKRDLEFGNPLVQPSTFFTRTALSLVGGVDPSLHYAMDLDLWLRFVDHQLRWAFMPNVLSSMIYDARSKTGGLDPSCFFKEEVIVYTRHARPRAALLALGRVAAYRAALRGSGSKVLNEAVEGTAEWARQHGLSVPLDDLRRVAKVEASFRDLHVGTRLSAALDLLTPARWAEQASRERIVHGLRRKALAPLYEGLLRRRLLTKADRRLVRCWP